VSETYLNKELSDNYSEILAESFVTAQRFLAELRSDIIKDLNRDSTSGEVAQLQAEIETYEAQLDRANELYILGQSNIDSVKKITLPIIEKKDNASARVRELTKSKDDKMYDLIKISESMEELKLRLSEIYEVEKTRAIDFYKDADGNFVRGEDTFDEDFDGYGVYNPDFDAPPKKHFTQEEILNDIDRILVHGERKLTIEFKTFTEVEQLVNKHEHIMTERTLAIFNELKSVGWDRRLCYEHYDFWN